MSDTKRDIRLAGAEKLMEFTIETIQRHAQARVVVLVIVHEDQTIQSSATLIPGTEQRAMYALHSLAEKIGKGEVSRVSMSKEIKN